MASRIGGVRDAAERGVGARTARPGSALALALALAGCVNLELPVGGRGELTETLVLGTSGPKVLMLDVTGVLREEDEEGAFGLGGRESPVARAREALERAREDREVRALLLRIHSPGGTVTASDVLHREVLRFKEEKKVPVVAECVGLCASGAYYVAMAADRVLAHPTSVVGSIGVIFSGLSLAGLMEKLGVEDQTVKSGAMKDAGSPWRRMTPAERAQIQSLIDDFHARFLEVVARGRPALAPEAVARLADGRVYSARQAKEAGLVDEIAYLPEAVEETKRRAGLTEARVVVYHRPREWRENLYSVSAPAPPRAEGAAAADALARALRAGPAFLYLWWPGLAD